MGQYDGAVGTASLWLLICGLLLLQACTSSVPQVPRQDDWPPGKPRQAQRLRLLAGEQTDPLLWWSQNILEMVPPDIYPDAQTARQAEDFIAETNAKRTAAGLQPLVPLPLMNRVAQAHALDQATRDYWNHRTPEDLGSRDRILAAGKVDVMHGGENSAVARPGQATVRDVVDEFSIHPGHRELLYDPEVEFIGVGIYNYSPAEHIHFVQLLVSF